MSGSDPERPQFLFVKVLASRGRLEAVTQQMGYHPQYLDSFLKMQHYLLHMDGPLPFDCRHYIAIMVSPAGSCRRGREGSAQPRQAPRSPSARQPAPGASLQRPKSWCPGGWVRGGRGVPGCLSHRHGAGTLTCRSCRRPPGTNAGTW